MNAQGLRKPSRPINMAMHIKTSVDSGEFGSTFENTPPPSSPEGEEAYKNPVPTKRRVSNYVRPTTATLPKSNPIVKNNNKGPKEVVAMKSDSCKDAAKTMAPKVKPASLKRNFPQLLKEVANKRKPDSKAANVSLKEKPIDVKNKPPIKQKQMKSALDGNTISKDTSDRKVPNKDNKKAVTKKLSNNTVVLTDSKAANVTSKEKPIDVKNKQPIKQDQMKSASDNNTTSKGILHTKLPNKDDKKDVTRKSSDNIIALISSKNEAKLKPSRVVILEDIQLRPPQIAGPQSLKRKADNNIELATKPKQAFTPINRAFQFNKTQQKRPTEFEGLCANIAQPRRSQGVSQCKPSPSWNDNKFNCSPQTKEQLNIPDGTSFSNLQKKERPMGKPRDILLSMPVSIFDEGSIDCHTSNNQQSKQQQSRLTNFSIQKKGQQRHRSTSERSTEKSRENLDAKKPITLLSMPVSIFDEASIDCHTSNNQQSKQQPNLTNTSKSSMSIQKKEQQRPMITPERPMEKPRENLDAKKPNMSVSIFDEASIDCHTSKNQHPKLQQNLTKISKCSKIINSFDNNFDNDHFDIFADDSAIRTDEEFDAIFNKVVKLGKRFSHYFEFSDCKSSIKTDSDFDQVFNKLVNLAGGDSYSHSTEATT